MTNKVPELQVRVGSETFFRVADELSYKRGDDKVRVAGLGLVPRWRIAERRMNNPYPAGGFVAVSS